jgi:hypothetical protein
MNAQQAIMNILQNDSVYSALVGSGTSTAIFYDEAMEAQGLPFAIIQTDSINPNDSKSGASTLDQDMVYVTHFAATKKMVISMSLAARTALERKNGTFNGIAIIGLQFRTQRSDTERLIDKKVFTEEQLYQVMTQQ